MLGYHFGAERHQRVFHRFTVWHATYQAPQSIERLLSSAWSFASFLHLAECSSNRTSVLWEPELLPRTPRKNTTYGSQDRSIPTVIYSSPRPIQGPITVVPPVASTWPCTRSSCKSNNDHVSAKASAFDYSMDEPLEYSTVSCIEAGFHAEYTPVGRCVLQHADAFLSLIPLDAAPIQVSCL